MSGLRSEAASADSKKVSAKVLVVDDEPYALRAVKRALTERGLEVFTSDSPLGVSGLIRKHEPDVLVLDVNMPAMSGRRLAELVAAGTGVDAEPVPIVFYSGVAEHELYAVSRAVRNSTYVSKNDGTDVLFAAILRTLKLDSARSGMHKFEL